MSELLFGKNFFNDDGNWKNSEVMKEFVNIIERGETAQQTDQLQAKEVEEPTFEIASDAEIDQLVLDANTNIVASVENVHDSLKKLAIESQKYDNEKATFEIEKAASILEDILLTVSGEQ